MSDSSWSLCLRAENYKRTPRKLVGSQAEEAARRRAKALAAAREEREAKRSTWEEKKKLIEAQRRAMRGGPPAPLALARDAENAPQPPADADADADDGEGEKDAAPIKFAAASISKHRPPPMTTTARGARPARVPLAPQAAVAAPAASGALKPRRHQRAHLHPAPDYSNIAPKVQRPRKRWETASNGKGASSEGGWTGWVGLSSPYHPELPLAASRNRRPSSGTLLVFSANGPDEDGTADPGPCRPEAASEEERPHRHASEEFQPEHPAPTDDPSFEVYIVAESDFDDDAFGQFLDATAAFTRGPSVAEEIVVLQPSCAAAELGPAVGTADSSDEDTIVEQQQQVVEQFFGTETAAAASREPARADPVVESNNDEDALEENGREFRGGIPDGCEEANGEGADHSEATSGLLPLFGDKEAEVNSEESPSPASADAGGPDPVADAGATSPPAEGDAENGGDDVEATNDVNDSAEVREDVNAEIGAAAACDAPKGATAQQHLRAGSKARYSAYSPTPSDLDLLAELKWPDMDVSPVAGARVASRKTPVGRPLFAAHDSPAAAAAAATFELGGARRRWFASPDCGATSCERVLRKRIGWLETQLDAARAVEVQRAAELSFAASSVAVEEASVAVEEFRSRVDAQAHHIRQQMCGEADEERPSVHEQEMLRHAIEELTRCNAVLQEKLAALEAQAAVAAETAAATAAAVLASKQSSANLSSRTMTESAPSGIDDDNEVGDNGGNDEEEEEDDGDEEAQERQLLMRAVDEARQAANEAAQRALADADRVSELQAEVGRIFGEFQELARQNEALRQEASAREERARAEEREAAVAMAREAARAAAEEGARAAAAEATTGPLSELRAEQERELRSVRAEMESRVNELAAATSRKNSISGSSAPCGVEERDGQLPEQERERLRLELEESLRRAAAEQLAAERERQRAELELLKEELRASQEAELREALARIGDAEARAREQQERARAVAEEEARARVASAEALAREAADRATQIQKQLEEQLRLRQVQENECKDSLRGVVSADLAGEMSADDSVQEPATSVIVGAARLPPATPHRRMLTAPAPDLAAALGPGLARRRRRNPSLDTSLNTSVGRPARGSSGHDRARRGGQSHSSSAWRPVPAGATNHWGTVLFYQRAFERVDEEEEEEENNENS